MQDFEVIAVDDGSSDNTLELLTLFAKHNPGVKVISQSHQGIIAALNNGLFACQVEYVARMDADDLCHPQRLEKQLLFMENHPDISAVSCLVQGFPTDQVRGGFQVYIEWLNSLVQPQDIQREIFIESPLVHPSVLFRKSCVMSVGGYQDNGWAEDYDLWLRLYLQGAKFAKLPDILYEWREQPDRLTRTDARYSLENFLRCKAYYLSAGPLVNCDAVIIWGAGMTGRRLSKHLVRAGVPLVGFLDVDPRKIGGSLRHLPIYSHTELPQRINQFQKTILLAAVASRGAREIIRQKLNNLGLIEGSDWWSVA